MPRRAHAADLTSIEAGDDEAFLDVVTLPNPCRSIVQEAGSRNSKNPA
jgi:hypothetical protein